MASAYLVWFILLHVYDGRGREHEDSYAGGSATSQTAAAESEWITLASDEKREDFFRRRKTSIDDHQTDRGRRCFVRCIGP